MKAQIIPAQADFAVFVASSLDEVGKSGIKPPYAIITPDTNDWNDYGRGYFAHLWIEDGTGEPEEIRLSLMFEGYERTKKALDGIIAQQGDVLSIEKIAIPFVSLIPDEANYRKIFRIFGFDLSISMLRKLHDAVAQRIEQTDQKTLDLIKGEEFHVGVLRQTGARTALRRGGRHFRRDLPQTVEDAAVKFTFLTTLKSAENEIEVEFDFTEKPVLRDRVAVLIGRNGVGKTQLLNAIVRRLPEASRSPGQVNGENFPPPHSRVLLFSSVPTDPFPEYLPAWDGIDYEYFPINESLEEGADPLLASLVACRFDRNIYGFGARGRASRLDILRDSLSGLGLWARLCLPVTNPTAHEYLPSVMEVAGGSYIPITASFNELQDLQAAQRIDWARSPIIVNKDRERRELSSGEYAMLRFAGQAAAAIETGSLLLLDEPETHLHPNFISDMMEILYGLLKTTGSVAIIATHSAYIVREVSREGVQVMSISEGQLSVDRPRLQTFGASVDTISQFIFGDTNFDHHYQAILKDWVESRGRELGLKGIIAQFGSVLNPESLAFIARELDRDDGAA
jgi:ABC-type branched-subunit amino acid transport system ATPase component